MFISGSYCTPTLLAYLINEKYGKAVPLYHLENEFKSKGIPLSRTTTLADCNDFPVYTRETGPLPFSVSHSPLVLVGASTGILYKSALWQLLRFSGMNISPLPAPLLAVTELFSPLSSRQAVQGGHHCPLCGLLVEHPQTPFIIVSRWRRTCGAYGEAVILAPALFYFHAER